LAGRRKIIECEDRLIEIFQFKEGKEKWLKKMSGSSEICEMLSVSPYTVTERE
jgi:hypothetical protein